MERLFVYGSLQPGGSNEHILADMKGEWKPGFVKGKLLKKGWGSAIGYPGLILDETEDEVSGYVFTSEKLSDKWDFLDKFEGEEYERKVTTVYLNDGEQVKAYVYAARK